MLQSRPGPGTPNVLNTSVGEPVNPMPFIFYLLWLFLTFKTLKIMPAQSQSVLSNLWIILLAGLHLVNTLASWISKLEDLTCSLHQNLRKVLERKRWFVLGWPCKFPEGEWPRGWDGALALAGNSWAFYIHRVCPLPPTSTSLPGSSAFVCLCSVRLRMFSVMESWALEVTGGLQDSSGLPEIACEEQSPWQSLYRSTSALAQHCLVTSSWN